MRKNVSQSSQSIRVALVALCSALAGLLLVTVRYILSTPQPLESEVPGEAGIYKWKHGHIFYKVSGDEAAPPLVMWHSPEMGGSSYEMRDIVAGLAQHYRVYVPDLLGYGLSDHPRLPYRAQTYIALGQDFLRDVVGQPAVLLASGRSCNYSVAIASETPDLCTKLIFLSPYKLLYRAQLGDYKYRALLENSLSGLVCYAICSRAFFLRRLIAREHQQAPQQVTQGELHMYTAVAHQLGARHAGLALLAGHLELDVINQLSDLSQPLLVLWGEQVRGLAAVRAIIARGTRVVVVEDAAVKVQEQRPVKVVASILAWQEAEIEPLRDQVNVDNNDSHLVAELARIQVEHDPVFVTAVARDEPGLLKTASVESEGTSEVSTFASKVEPVLEELVESRVESREEIVEPVVEEPVEYNVESGKSLEVLDEKEEGAEEVEEPGKKVEASEVSAYCVKCREKRSMHNAKKITTKNGRSAMEGTCPICGTKLFRFVAA